MKKRIGLCIFPLIAVILEFLPFGAAVPYDSGAELHVESFPCFSIIPLRYGNPGPFLTSILSCVLVVLAAIYLIGEREHLAKTLRCLSVFSLVTSLLPIFVQAFTAAGALVSLCMGMELLCTLPDRKEGPPEPQA